MARVGTRFPRETRLRLIALELHGFKSFADPQKLVFPGGMTAVVGPNGCGKSNISDALAWVLGEQRATLLRGSEMSDVIFAGTSARKAMGMSEVKLTLEMPDPALPGATRETVISRRLFRDSGASYRLNGRECRLKDIQDLLLDTGMGTRAYSFIQQGQIDLILSSKPKDRRSLLEEAAGITRYKLRRQEAERRLEDTRANLQRLDDILFELGKQLDGLKRQAARARRAQELDGAIKATQRILLAGKALELEAAKERIVEHLEGLERQIAVLTAQASEKASEVEHQRQVLHELERAQERRSREQMALEQKLSLLEQDRLFQEERQREAQEQQRGFQGRLEELSTRSGDATAEAERLQARLAEAETALAQRECGVTEAEQAVALALGGLRHVEGELRDLRARRAEAEREALALQRQRQTLHQQVAQLEGRLEALNHEESVRAPRLEALTAEVQRLGRERSASEERLEAVEEAVQVQQRLLGEAQEVHRTAGTTLREREAELDRAEHRLRQVADALRQASGDARAQEALAWLRTRGQEPEGLAEALTVKPELLPFVERLLGPWLQTLSLGTGVLESLAEMPGQAWIHADSGTEGPAAPEGCEALAPGLTWRPGKMRPLEALLARSYRCGDAELPDLAAQHPDLAFVSPRLVRLPFGPIQVGAEAPAVSPLKLQAERDAAKQAREALLDEVEGLEQAAKVAQQRHQEAAERFREMEEDRLLARRAQEDLRGREASAQAQLREIHEAQARADEAWERLEVEIGGLRAQLRDLERPQENPEVAELTEQIHAAEARLQEVQSVLEQQRAALVAATQVRAAAWADRDSLQRQVLQLQRGAFDLEAEKRRTEEDLEAARERERAAGSRLEQLEGETQATLEARRNLAEQQGEAMPVLDHAVETLRVLERGGRELQQALENARQLHQETLLSGAQVQGSLEALAKEVELALGFRVPEFLASITEDEREAWNQGELVHQTRLSELQGKRLDLGSVNPLAIQELEEAESRLGFMNQQRSDVMEAIGNLEATIREINTTSEERFREAFDYVNARFSEVFREVFGGGSAHLALQDPKDLLECGIEITAQPPGKTAKALTLLSGGEKALTAISLLFAIFAFKPSPFCVLDEVDAPLDEANVARFAKLVQRMKRDTQFIVITHQKPTMVAADTLYGVTMEEQGISRLVSVQLREAEQLV